MRDDIDSKQHGTLLNKLEYKLADHYNLPLVKQFYKKNGMRAQAPKGDIIYTSTLNEVIVAALRLHPVENCYLLRSMCVCKELRKQGIGSALLHNIQNPLNKITCYSFPFSHLTDFYKQSNFISCDPNNTPKAIIEKFNRYIKNGKKICLMKHHQTVLK